MLSSLPTRYLVAGQLKRDYLIFPDGSTALDCPGGSVLYAASGLGLWEEGIGLLARVGEDYPQTWLDDAETQGFDRRGIHILPEELDVRNFLAWPPEGPPQTEDPVSQFSRLGQPFPLSLLGYQPPEDQPDSRVRLGATSVRAGDVPSDYLDAGSAHLCPMDYLTHNMLPAVFRQGHITTLTLDPGPNYMDPAFWDAVPAIVRGLTAFLCSEQKLRRLFLGRSHDLWEMAARLAELDCEIIVIKRGERGQLLYDGGSKRKWEIPAYPVQPVNPAGNGDAFCGGFLAGYRKTYDPLQAVCHGSISASFNLEGRGPNYAHQALPALAEARLSALQNMVRRV
jgi:hypothetical protein